jgi:hypothetical protein
LTLIIFPGFIDNFFIKAPSSGGDIFIRFLGSTLFGYSCLNWFTSNFEKSEAAIRVCLASNLSTLTVAFFISLIGLLNGTFKATGILIVILHFGFAAGFSAYIYKMRN